MEDLPIHSAIEELVNIIFFEQKKMLKFGYSSVVAIDINTSGPESTVEKDQYLYKIIVSGIYKASDISIYIQKGFLKTLMLIIKKMQALVKNDCHLCEIETCSVSNEVTQRNYTISEHPQTGENQINQSGSFQLNTKFRYKSCWYFGVFQRHKHMVAECRSVYEYLQKLKVFNPDDVFKYTLELSEITCHPNYSSSLTFEINGKKLLNITESHAKRAIRKNLHSKPILSPSVAVNVFNQQNDGDHILKFSSIGLNIQGNNYDDEDKKYLIEFFIFGPNGEPLHIPAENEEMFNLVQWEKYGLTMTFTDFPNTSLNPSLKPEWFVVAQPDMTNVSNENYSHFVIYLVFEISHRADFGDINILAELYNNLGSVLHRNKGQIEESVQCVTDKLFAHKIKVDRKKKEEEYAVNTISDAIWNIVLRSTDDDFRENSLLTLGATSVHELKVLVEKKLRKIKVKQRSVLDSDSSQSPSCSFDLLEQVAPDDMDLLFAAFGDNNKRKKLS